MKKLYALITLCLFFSQTYAQSWQWGKRGGGPFNILPLPLETVIDMATDQHNNVYVMSNVGQSSVNVDGHPKSGYGPENIMISSFKCDGSFRWAKVIGSYSNTTRAQALKVDTLGNVYASMSLSSPQNTSQTAIHIDADSTLPYNDPKTMYLVVYDTSGNYKHLHAPQPDTIGVSTNNSYGIDVDVDNSGNVYWFCHLAPGLLSDNINQVITTAGFYILKYNSSGTIAGIVPMQLSGGLANMHMIRDEYNGRFYISGSLGAVSCSMGGNPVTHSMCIGAFNSSGQFIWKRENANPSGELYDRVAIGTNSSVYISGGFFSFNVTDTMCGFVLPGANASPFVINIDSNGTGIWYRYSIVNGSTNSHGVALRTNNEVVITGSYPRKLKWFGSADSLNLNTNALYDIYIARFNAQTGALVKMDTLASNFGYEEHASSIVADKKGNIYVGGYFTSALYVGNDTLVSAGGESDFFIAKYGSANCSTTSIETPSVSVSNEIKVYPNPSTGILHIDNLKEAYSYRIVNLIGSTIQQGTVQSPSNEISLKEIPSGIYVMDVTCESGFRTMMKVIKE